MSETLRTISKMVQEVMHDEVIVPITEETSFSEDLQLESIELVALGEKVQAAFGDRVNFAEWVSNKDLDELIRLRVGDLVEFIDSCQS